MNAPVLVNTKPGDVVPTRAPFGLFGSFQHEFDRLFGDFTPGFAMPFTRSPAEVKCKMDLAETKDGFELSFELPGLEEKDVDVAVADGYLTVSGDKTFDAERKDKTYRFIERGYGAFSRTVALPEGVEPEKIKASMSKGVLTVFIPTPAKTGARKIEVKPAA